MTIRDVPSGVIILEHPGYFAVDPTAALAALPSRAQGCPRERLVLDLATGQERAITTRDWQDAARILLDGYRAKVKPVLTAHPDYDFTYFGTVSIPLAVQLGFLVGTWHPVNVFQHHHGQKDWRWPDPDGAGPALEVETSPLSSGGSLAEGDLVVRVSTSHVIEPALTRELVSRPLAEVDIKTRTISEDTFASPRDVEVVADAFKATIDELHRLYPNATALHLFAACPVGLALKLGTRVSPTIHPPVQTYEFDAKSNPKYYRALLLQAEPAPSVALTAEEQASAVAERMIWREELARIRGLAASLPELVDTDGWLADVLPTGNRAAFGSSWRALPRLTELADLRNSDIDLVTTEVPGGFAYVPDRRTWVLGDELLVPVLRRIVDQTQRRRAARLFLLHEALHGYQRLTLATAPQIGRFPKVLEDIDYHADAWAQLHERRLTTEVDPPLLSDEPALARLLIRVATETMLAFDDAPQPSAAMQVRRVSRYLIWAWQYLRTERFVPDGDVWTVLSDKPSIEIAGPEIRARDNRVWYLLDPRFTTAPEVAVYWQNRLHRFAAGPASPHEEVLEALRVRDGDRLRSALRGVFDLVVSPVPGDAGRGRKVG